MKKQETHEQSVLRQHGQRQWLCRDRRRRTAGEMELDHLHRASKMLSRTGHISVAQYDLHVAQGEAPPQKPNIWLDIFELELKLRKEKKNGDSPQGHTDQAADNGMELLKAKRLPEVPGLRQV